MTAFNFTQPFLMNSLLNWLGEENVDRKRDSGFGLIGAYALVFMGIAVSQPFQPSVGINEKSTGFHRETLLQDVSSKCCYPRQSHCNPIF